MVTFRLYIRSWSKSRAAPIIWNALTFPLYVLQVIPRRSAASAPNTFAKPLFPTRPSDHSSVVAVERLTIHVIFEMMTVQKLNVLKRKVTNDALVEFRVICMSLSPTLPRDPSEIFDSLVLTTVYIQYPSGCIWNATCTLRRHVCIHA